MATKKNKEEPVQMELEDMLDELEQEASDQEEQEEEEQEETPEASKPAATTAAAAAPVKEPPKKKEKPKEKPPKEAKPKKPISLKPLFKKKTKSEIIRINVLKTNDNRILVDLKTLESLIDNKIIEVALHNEKLDLSTLEKMKNTLSDINDTAVLRIIEQNSTSTRYINNTIKELEINRSKLFE